MKKILRSRFLNSVVILGIFCMIHLVVIDTVYAITDDSYQGTSIGGKSSVAIVSCAGGIRINTFNGNLFYPRTDLTIPGRGLPMEIKLSYNSIDRDYDWGFGYGWRFNYHMSYYVEGDLDVIIYWGDGRKDLFDESSGSYTPVNEGVFCTLEKYHTGKFRLTTKEGIKFLFEDSNHKKLTKILDRNDNTLSFTYNGENQLTTITDAAGRTLTLDYINGRVITITDNNTSPPRTLQYTYDVDGNLTSFTDTLGNTTTYAYDSFHRMTTITDPLNSATTIAYNASGLVSSITTDLSSRTFSYNTVTRTTTITDDIDGTETAQTQYVYDENNRLVQTIDSLNGTENRTYDVNGNLATITDVIGNTTSFTYDSRGNILIVTDPENHTTTYTYESTFNKIASITDANNQTTTFEYDTNGNLIRITDPLSNETTYTYDSYGQRLAKTDANEHTTTYQCNTYGNQTMIIDDYNKSTTLAYDTVGNLTTSTDANGNTTTFIYDRENRLVSVTDAESNTVSYTYDANGNRTSVTTPKGTTTYTYDALSRITKVTNALNLETSYTYDNVSNRLSITDPKGNTTTFEYDKLNRLTEETDPLSKITQYGYDAVGNMISMTDGKGQTTTYQYDNVNRMTQVTYPDSSTVNYAYDAVGNRTDVIDSQTDLDYTYDALNRVTQITDNKLSKTISYIYDAVGNRLSMTGPEGIVTFYTYDNVDRIKTITRGSDFSTYDYDDAARLIKCNLPNSSYTEYTYDDADRLISVANKKSDDTVISSFTYLLDGIGNRTKMTLANGDYVEYTYDAISQLTSEIKKDSGDSTIYSRTFTYDDNGNRNQRNADGVITTYAYNDADQLTQEVTDGVTTIYQYDNNGNLTQKTVGGNTYTYSYDYEDRMTSFSSPTESASYVYDALDRRISKTVGATVRKHFYDGPNALVEYDGTNFPQASYIFGLDIDDNIAKIIGGNTYYYVKDGLNSVRNILDSSEVVQNSYDYYAFGKILSTTETVDNDYTFTGREWDDESELYYYRARYYDPASGRFLLKDPFRFLDGSNLYTYVKQNPVNFVDPIGEFIGLAIAALAIAAGLAAAYYGMRQAQSAAESFNAIRERQFQNPGGPESRTLGDLRSMSEFQQGVKTIVENIPGTSLTGPPPTSATDVLTGLGLNALNQIDGGAMSDQQGVEGDDTYGKQPTLITLTLFTAIPYSSSSQILIQWQTSSEIDNYGYNIWRSTAEDSDYTKINTHLIEAEGGPIADTDYTYLDDSVISGITYFYMLEDIDIHGVSNFHDPVSASIPNDNSSAEDSSSRTTSSNLYYGYMDYSQNIYNPFYCSYGSIIKPHTFYQSYIYQPLNPYKVSNNYWLSIIYDHQYNNHEYDHQSLSMLKTSQNERYFQPFFLNTQYVLYSPQLFGQYNNNMWPYYGNWAYQSNGY